MTPLPFIFILFVGCAPTSEGGRQPLANDKLSPATTTTLPLTRNPNGRPDHPADDNDPYLPEGWIPNWVQNQPGNLQRQSWTKHIFRETLRLSSRILDGYPRDIEDYCPNWSNLDRDHRRAFFTVFVTAIAKWESNFNPQDYYKEGYNDSTGRPVISRGLLQLSVQSAQSYGCRVNENTLHDPYLNLSCGISILNKWIANDNYLGSSVPEEKDRLAHLGGARYWSVLRNHHLSRGRIITYLKTQKLCWP